MVRILVCTFVLAVPTIVVGQPRVAPPTFSVGGGDYTSVVMVVVRVSTPGATIRFTQNGLDPTESDPVIVSGSRLAINTSLTLKARAWKTGFRPSEVRSATYRIGSPPGGSPIGAGAAAAGGAQSVLALPDGSVHAWTTQLSSAQVAGLSGVVDVAAGTRHALAVTRNGHIHAWGANGSGQLGDGTRMRRERPVRLEAVADVVRVVAGRAHSLALTSDGRVLAWGANTRGQLGIGSTKSARHPTTVAALSDVVSIAAGPSHSVAITRSGELYTWGANAQAQLGDGSRQDRLTPVRIALTDVVDAAAGGGHTLALLRDGSVYSWGAGERGQLGTGSTTRAPAPVAIDGLRAVAVRAGRNFSAAIQPDGTLMTWGANDSGQLGDGSLVDRLTPVRGPALLELSTLALGSRHAIAVTASGDVWTWGRDVAPIETMSDIAHWGPSLAHAELLPPTITPPSATYPAPQTVSIGGGENVTIRYTLDGSDPTLHSTPYLAPFVVAANTTVKARAYASSPHVEPGAVASAFYVIDMSPPTIVAKVSPPSTAAWFLTPVVVTFECADDSAAVICPPPVTVSGDGASQVVSGTAVDSAGNQATAAVTLNVDRSPPSLVLINSPDSSSTTATQVLVTGRVSDTASGLAGPLRCNGGDVAVVQEAFECVVSLRPGVNQVTVYTSDIAGHFAHVEIAITRVDNTMGLAIAPNARTMVLREVAPLSLTDESGAAVSGAAWESSNLDIAVLSNDDPPVVTAMAAGTATISAMKDGRTAESTIIVSTAAALLPGTVRWTIAPTAGFTMEPPIFTNRVDPSVPDMFLVETKTWGEATLRAVTSEGELLWTQESPGVPLMGDSFGGVIAGVLYSVDVGFEFRKLVRLGDAGGVSPWQYESSGALLRPAQAADGTLYAIEYVPGLDQFGDRFWDKQAVVIDGTTGHLIDRRPLPRDVDTYVAGLEEEGFTCTSTRFESAPETVGPIVGSDERGYLLIRRRLTHMRDSCFEQTAWPQRTIDNGVDLMILSPAAAPVVQPIFAETCNVPRFAQAACDVPPSLNQVVPDGIGGVLANWRRGTLRPDGLAARQTVVTRRGEEGTLSDRPMEASTTIQSVGQNGIVYVPTAEGYSAIHATTWTPIWTAEDVSAPLAAHPDGGAAVFEPSSGTYRTVNNAGQLDATVLHLPMRSPVQEFGNWIGVGGAGLLSVAGPFPDASRWRAGGGNRQGNLRLRTPGVGIFAKSHRVQAPLNFQHVSIRVAPTFQNFWRDLKPIEFVNVDEYGNYFMTIGAGTAEGDTSAACSGTLTKGLNRERDVHIAPTNLEKLPLNAFDELRVINDLFVYFGGYKDDLPYACVPELNPGKYNSNSFASGILRRAGAPSPLFPIRGNTVPGWATPVPPTKFEP